MVNEDLMVKGLQHSHVAIDHSLHTTVWLQSRDVHHLHLHCHTAAK